MSDTKEVSDDPMELGTSSTVIAKEENDKESLKRMEVDDEKEPEEEIVEKTEEKQEEEDVTVKLEDETETEVESVDGGQEEKEVVDEKQDATNRVKLYVLCDQRIWEDRGTGHVVTHQLSAEDGAPSNAGNTMVLVRLEGQNKNMLESRIQMDTVYQKQQLNQPPSFKNLMFFEIICVQFPEERSTYFVAKL
nr:hypothetical protein F41E6.4 - Caenorhabditis elegans [Caenorhabditis elegans]